MKKVLVSFLLLILCFTTGCSSTDSSLINRINQLEDRITELEQELDELRGQIGPCTCEPYEPCTCEQHEYRNTLSNEIKINSYSVISEGQTVTFIADIENLTNEYASIRIGFWQFERSHGNVLWGMYIYNIKFSPYERNKNVQITHILTRDNLTHVDFYIGGNTFLYSYSIPQ